MVAHVGVAHITIILDESNSLKDKRRVIKSIIQKTRNRHNAAIAEVDDLDDRHSAVLAISCVSNSNAQTDRMLSEVIRFIESNLNEGYVGTVSTEIDPY